MSALRARQELPTRRLTWVPARLPPIPATLTAPGPSSTGVHTAPKAAVHVPRFPAPVQHLLLPSLFFVGHTRFPATSVIRITWVGRTDNRVVLFFDPRWTVEGNVSCATRHQPALYATDALTKSLGVQHRTHPRHAPTVLNAALVGGLLECRRPGHQGPRRGVQFWPEGCGCGHGKHQSHRGLRGSCT
jgi:hypothetical protein